MIVTTTMKGNKADDEEDGNAENDQWGGCFDVKNDEEQEEEDDSVPTAEKTVSQQTDKHNGFPVNPVSYTHLTLPTILRV